MSGTPVTAVNTVTSGGGQAKSGEPDPSVPRVSNPKRLRGSDPCALLTQAQLTSLGLPAKGKPAETTLSEPKCTWSDDIRVTLGLDTKRRGLTEFYTRQKAFDNFKSSQVAGFPVVWMDFSNVLCNLAVGVADDQVLTIHVGSIVSRSRAQGNTCGYGETVAAEVLKNLPVGG
nr:hypothetical protein GCM10020241_39480 [Streptoalloteichus tenebrarius]